MKWSIQQLHKLIDKPLAFEENIDFTELASQVSDIIKIKPAKVSGEISMVLSNKFRVKYHVSVLIVMQCALTLEPVNYEFEKDYDEIYSFTPAEDEYWIEKNTLDLDSAVWSNIIIDKPMVITREDAYEILKERGISLNEDMNNLDEQEKE